MGTDTWILIISIAVLIALSAFFSATETAYSSLNKIRVKQSAAEGDKKSQKVLKISDQFDRALSAILIGNNIVNIASASLGTILFTDLFGAAGALISTIAMTLLVLTFGEILPKSYAKANSERMAMFSCDILWALMKVFTPLIAVFSRLSSVLKRGEGEEEPSVTQDELKYIIEEIEDEGVLKQQESELLQSALEFEKITVDEILTPRVDVVAVALDDTIEEIRETFDEHRFSRIPVYEKSIDNIVGILYEREFLRALASGKDFEIKDLIRKTIYLPEHQPISVILKQLQTTKIHMAVVTDDHGGTVGIVTLEDIVEELIGEIWDEKDTIEEAVSRVGENTYDVDADMNVFDMLELLEVTIPDFEPEANTVGGWVMETLSHVPTVGESFECDRLLVTVKEMDEQRIQKVRILLAPIKDEEI